MPEGGDTEALLASVKVFSGLEPRELEEVARVAVPRSFDRGEVVFREGDPGDTCYVVRSGTVSIRRDHPDGRSRALAELRNGAIFGELSMFGAETRSATAATIAPKIRSRWLASTSSREALGPGRSLRALRSPESPHGVAVTALTII